MESRDEYSTQIANVIQIEPRFNRLRQAFQRIGLSAALVFGGTGIGLLELETSSPQAQASDANGGYPDADAVDCSATHGVFSWCKDGSDISPRGFGYRNCTDWAAYESKKLTGMGVPYGAAMGDAHSWDDNAPSHGFTVTSIPEAGDIAESDSDHFGHVGVVEQVNKDSSGKITSINISQYNAAGDGNYTMVEYAPDANGSFWRGPGLTRKWDHFIDLNGVGNGVIGASGGGSTTPPSPGEIPYAAVADGQPLWTKEGWVYEKVGGADFPIKWGWNQNDSNKWGRPVGPVSVAEVHDHEAGYDQNGNSYAAHPPSDGTVVYKDGSLQQWYFTHGRAYPIGAADLDDLGVRNRAMRIPATGNRLDQFTYGIIHLPSGSLYRFASNPRVNQMVGDKYGNQWANYVNNDTVLSCFELTQGSHVEVLPQSAQPYIENYTGITESSTSAACEFPSGMVLFGPGGLEQWRIEGNNREVPYWRRYYPNALTVYLNTSGNPQYRTLRSIGAINGVQQGIDMDIPNGVFFIDDGNGQVFKAENGVFRPVPWPDMLSCLGNPSEVHVPASVIGALPQGPQMSCDYENRILVRPDGRAYYVAAGRRHPIGNPAIRDCVSVRFGAGTPVNVPDSTIEGYIDDTGAYCPYDSEPGLNFVQEQGDPTVWLVDEKGVRRHVGRLCVVDAYTTVLKKFHVFTVPTGETAGAVQGPDFWGDPENCGELPG